MGLITGLGSGIGSGIGLGLGRTGVYIKGSLAQAQNQPQDQFGILLRQEQLHQANMSLDDKEPSFKEKLQKEVDEWLKPVRR